jgi:hypothetical protein
MLSVSAEVSMNVSCSMAFALLSGHDPLRILLKYKEFEDSEIAGLLCGRWSDTKSKGDRIAISALSDAGILDALALLTKFI